MSAWETVYSAGPFYRATSIAILYVGLVKVAIELGGRAFVMR